MERKERNLTAFLRRGLRLQRLFALFRDIRRDPVIPLKTLLGMIFCMPFFGCTSMLAVNRQARTRRHLAFFDAEHRRDRVKMVASDFTLQRLLRWLDPQPARTALFQVAHRLDRMGLLSRRVSPQAPR